MSIICLSVVVLKLKHYHLGKQSREINALGMRFHSECLQVVSSESEQRQLPKTHESSQNHIFRLIVPNISRMNVKSFLDC